jgi:iron complex outermembrane recepter protein
MIIKSVACLLFTLLLVTAGFTQTLFRGSVLDKSSGLPLSGVNITVKNRLMATITDAGGHFLLSSSEPPPLVLLFSLPGFLVREIRLDTVPENLVVQMQSKGILQSRGLDDNSFRTPVSMEISAGHSAVSLLRGVQFTQSSLPILTVNARGFGASANMRIVQLSDGLDEAPPLFNFPVGTTGSITDLDVAHIEFLPGPSSARYGPNAFNGVMLTNSKNPFTYQGFSLDMTSGFSHSGAGGTHPYQQLSARYAKAVRGVAIKLNGRYLRATDWLANDYGNSRTGINPGPDAPDFDGLNTYGDELALSVPMASLAAELSQSLAPLFSSQLGLSVAETETLLSQTIPRMPALRIRRTGLRESDLLDSRAAGNLQLDGALHYRINGQLEASYTQRFTQTSAIIQDSERLALRDFRQRFHRLELRHPDYWLRSYWSLSDAGKSYSLNALGAAVLESFRPTTTAWLPAYAGRYAASLLPVYLSGAPANDQQLQIAHQLARNTANQGFPLRGSADFNALVDSVRQSQRLMDDSRMFHAEAAYDFRKWIQPTVASVQVGTSFRQFGLFSGGTILNEDPDATGRFERISLRAFGAYLAVSKTMLNERLTLSSLWRYDKQAYLTGQFSPSLAAVLTTGASQRHHVRGSFQRGFRNPTSQEQFMFLSGPQGIRLGSIAANADRYGIHNGGAFTEASYHAFMASLLAGSPDTGRLVRRHISFLQPEQQQSVELGYRGLLLANLLVDFSAHWATFRHMITPETVRAASSTTHRGEVLPGVADVLAGNATMATAWRPFVNSPEPVSTAGIGCSMAYQPHSTLTLYGNYQYIALTGHADEVPGFNTPEHTLVAGLSGQQLFKRLGFDVHYRWQDAFLWDDSFARAVIPTLGQVNARISYYLSDWKTTITAGGNNLLGEDYRTHAGAPFVGQLFYLGLRWDGLE